MTNAADMGPRNETPSIDPHHLLLIGAGPGVGGAVARRFAADGYHVTLVARGTDGLAKLAGDLAVTGAAIDTLTADASDPDGLRAVLASAYASDGAPGLLVYNASTLAPDTLLASDVAHLHETYDVDVVSAVVAAQVAAPAMQAGGGGTILFTGGGFADYPLPAMATISLGKAALRSAAKILAADLADDGVRAGTITIAGQVAPGTDFDPDRIAQTFWNVVQSEDPWQAEVRFEGK
jgi:short-subunit dehydrogenase